MSEEIKTRAGITKYNWPAMFVAWMKGTPVEELSEVFEVPVTVLRRAMKDQDWQGISEHAPVPSVGALVKRDDVHIKRCEENREKNLKIAEKLREDLAKVVEDVVTGKARLKRLFHNRGSIVEAEVPYGPQDRVALANYATMVANLTYRALGDREASTGAIDDKPGGSPPAPSITLVLPGAISNPRDIRPTDDPKAGQVIDLDKSFGGGAPHGKDRVSGADGGPGGKVEKWGKAIDTEALEEKTSH